MLNEVVSTTLGQVGTNALSAAVGVLGSRLATAVTTPRGRRAEDLSIARWFETFKLTKSFPELPGLSDEMASQLIDVLASDAAQAALQELLAARLTDANDAEAGRAREVFCLTLATADPALSAFGPPLAEYYDDEICALVARLEAAEPTLLAQIRSEALSARMLAVLRAIERHTAALSGRPNLRTEASFLASYRGHVLDRHGKLEPPYFDRRRRVPIADIYVPPTIYENTYTERTVAPVPADPPTLSVWELAGRLDRTVVLGDPGGGKTTASNVLMHYFASDASRQIPFLVTLRNYAAADPPEHSVVGHIENELSTFYQCPAPPGLVDMLLLTGRAVVFFDGLDELLDTSRRADVASRIEHFCREYPLAPVLVTSRVVGYDQARLDDAQFASYRLGGFRDEDVADYARKWFALEEGARTDESDTFLTESESVPDLRTNPLLLSLMCILYRGEGSLPRDRAEVYEQCARLLFKKWDAHRHIHQELRAGRYVEPILRHVAWWLFARDKTQTSVAERELVAETARFLHGKGFESEDDAHEAALEFVEFACGRLWVFSDAGTTPTGENLYAFTHRTFLEYFAACQLAYDSDTPEKLARTLAPHIARGEWEVVGELAVQIKDATSREGAVRIYETLLDEGRRRTTEGRSNILQFLARTLRSADPSPQEVRRLANEIFQFLFSGDPDDPIRYSPFAWQLASGEFYKDIIDGVVAESISAMVISGDQLARLSSLRLAVSLGMAFNGGSNERVGGLPVRRHLRSFWSSRADDNVQLYREQIIEAAADDVGMRTIALVHELITPEQAMQMNGGLLPHMQSASMRVFGLRWASALQTAFYSVSHRFARERDIAELVAVGGYIKNHPQPPWMKGRASEHLRHIWNDSIGGGGGIEPLDPITYLGGAAIAFMAFEPEPTGAPQSFDGDPTRLGAFSDLHPYVKRRYLPDSAPPLPELPVPDEFKQVFRDWAAGKVNFTMHASGSPE